MRFIAPLIALTLLASPIVAETTQTPTADDKAESCASISQIFELLAKSAPVKMVYPLPAYMNVEAQEWLKEVKPDNATAYDFFILILHQNNQIGIAAGFREPPVICLLEHITEEQFLKIKGIIQSRQAAHEAEHPSEMQ
jgi:hypothetical protein